MQEYKYMKFLAEELVFAIEEMTKPTTIFIKEVKIVPGESVIKYEVLSKDGFKTKQLSFDNNIKK